MPPFKLVPYTYVPSKERRERIVFTKGAYNPKVKITDWEKHRESQPIDNDPYCPGSLNYTLSHYNRLGIAPVEKYVTTTRLMLEQIHNLSQMKFANPNKKLMNYYTYNDDMNCELKDTELAMCPKICAERYVSTMQDGYRAPHFCKIRRVALPVIPHLRYRRFQQEEPTLSPYKFYDEGFHNKSRCLAEHKRASGISYNPYTGEYTDGTIPEDGERECVELDYNNI